MKKWWAIWLAAVLLLTSVPFVPMTAAAQTEGNYTYDILADGTVEITDYSGSQSTVTIPSTIGGRRVTSIGEAAFFSTIGLKKVVIPDTVTNIGRAAFSSNSDLTSITLPSALSSLSDSMLAGCSSLKRITLPTTLRSIEAYALSDCSALESISLPQGLQEIGWNAFNGCSKLKSIVIPEGVEVISMSTFRDCTALTHVELPYGITTIDIYAFYGCEELVDLRIPSSVQVIGDGAFEECHSLKTISIPHGVTTIAPRTFLNCRVKHLSIPTTVTSIGKNAILDMANGGTVYYAGTQEQWNAIDIDSTNQHAVAAITYVYEARTASIVEHPSSVSVPNGEKATVSLEAVGDGLTYSWYFKNKGIASYAYTSTFQGDVYEVEMNDDRAGRTVYCVVKDQYGFEDRSRAATLDNTFAITKQPTSVKVPAGTLAKTTVKTSGSGLKYQWYVQDVGQSSFVKSSIKTATYSFTMTSAKSGRKVYCVITDSKGNKKQTDTVTLSMVPAPRITEHPTNVEAEVGERGGTSVGAAGDGLTYQWYFKDRGMGGFAKSSVRGAWYECEMTAAKHGRQVYCQVTDKYGQKIKTNTVTFTTKAPTILRQPAFASAALGKTVTTSVEARGVGLKYQWYYKNPKSTSFAKSSVKTAAYSYVMTDAKAGRQVYCVITDQFGRQVKTNTVTLNVPAPHIIKQPESRFVAVGKLAKATVKAEGVGLKYQWYYADYDGRTFASDKPIEYKKSAVKSATYSFTMTEEKRNRHVYCVITDKYGQSVKTNTVELGITRPTIVEQPQSSVTPVGKTASATVKADGVGLTYTWYVREAGTDYFVKSKIKTATYSFAMTAAKSGRQVYCVVTDKYGREIRTEIITFS